MKKKIVAIVLMFTLVFTMTLSGCGKDSKITADKGDNKVKETSTDKADDSSKDSKGADNFNKEGLPIVNESITLKVAAKKRDSIKKPFKELRVLEEIADATNVTIDWDVTPQASWPERKNLIIASGDWPDVFLGNYVIENKEVMKLAADGVLMPLENLIDNYAPNIKKVFEEYPEFRDYMTAPDGHIYSLPTINAYQSPAPSAQFINKKWLDEVGRDIPKTTDDFYETLKAFKNHIGDDQIPFTFRFENNIMGINGMFGAFGLVDNTDKLTIVNDKVLYTPMESQYKDAIIYFHKLFEEELIDVESFSQDVPVYKSKISNGNVGVCDMWSLSWLFGSIYNESDYTFMEPLEGPNGDRGYLYLPASELCGKGSFAVTTTCEHPEVAIRWADYMCDPEISFQLSQGPIGESYVENEDGMLEAVPDPEGMSHDEFRHMNTPGALSFHMIPASFLENVVPSMNIAEKQNFEKEYKKYATNMPLPPFFLSPEDASRAAEIQADIGSFVEENTSKWLMNGGIEEEWDHFVKQLKKMGADEYIAIYQNRYDEIKK